MSVDPGEAARILRKIAEAMTPEKIDPVVERVAVESFANLIKTTPKRWFGQVRGSWKMTKPAPGVRELRNDHKVLPFLEFGTKAHGPVNKKFLYIPKNRKAAFGWNPSLKRGVDYILTKKVRGIKPMHIVANEKEKANERLALAAEAHLRKAVNG